MGLPASKFGQVIEQEEPTQGSLPSTPILTPKTRLIDLDPRSPSENIVRTPIEILLAKHKENKIIHNEDLSSTEENYCDKNIYPDDIKLKNIDPRSPTIDFNRTPIIVPDDAGFPKKLHNKNLDKVRKTLETSPLARPLKKTSPQRIISPKLLESIVISPKPSENKRKSYVGLLETNLDYIETDLDTVKSGCKIDKESEDGYTVSSNLEEIPDNVITETELSEEYPIEDEERKSCCSSNESDTNLEQIQSFIDLEKLKIVDSPIRETPTVSNTSDGHPDDTDDDGLVGIASHKFKNIIEQQTDHDHDKQENRLKEESVRDFDKKLRNLIYEDKEKLEPTIKDKKISDYKSRVPLGTRNINTNVKKSILRLKVHDRPQKSNSEFSRIPIFQIKKGKGKLKQQCENTPPRNIEANNKVDKHQWDPDNTLII